MKLHYGLSLNKNQTWYANIGLKADMLGMYMVCLKINVFYKKSYGSGLEVQTIEIKQCHVNVAVLDELEVLNEDNPNWIDVIQLTKNYPIKYDYQHIEPEL